jgi:hypothetical protein
MYRGHGDATRLKVPDVDYPAFDAALENGGTDPAAVRIGMLNDFLGPGRFGRMFGDLAKFRPSDEGLEELGRAMRDEVPQDPAGDADVPAGMTYLGQFIDHDITGDKTVGFPEIEDVETIEQARSPSLDLDCLYGMGPVAQPELYDPSFPPDRARFRIGLTSENGTPLGQGLPNAPTLMPNDLPRAADRMAIIADHRNDENLVVAQLHLAFLKFHNAVMDSIPGPQQPPAGGYESCSYSRPDGGDTLFHRALKQVRYHYQWIVLREFLPSIVDATVLQEVLADGPKSFTFADGKPFMPVEFAVGAYRFGHSQVRERYDYNRVFNGGGPPALADGTLGLLFAFTGKSGFLPPNTHDTLPSNWVADWRRFFDFGRADLVNKTRKLDTRISLQLHELPSPSVAAEPPEALPVRNLFRGARVGLPTGQAVAGSIGAPVLDEAALTAGRQGDVLRQFGFERETPLWYYVLKEAEHGGGERLGPVGSRIVCEVFVGLLRGSPHSFLSEDPGWTPTLGPTPGNFSVADMIRLTGDINPLGAGAEGP